MIPFLQKRKPRAREGKSPWVAAGGEGKDLSHPVGALSPGVGAHGLGLPESILSRSQEEKSQQSPVAELETKDQSSQVLWPRHTAGGQRQREAWVCLTAAR